MKRISPGTVTLGVVAILFGLVTAYAVRHYSTGEVVQPPTPTPRLGVVIVPRVNLPKYSRINAEDIELLQVPLEKVPEGAVQVISRAVYRLVKATVMAGEPIMEASLYGVGEVPRLADQLPPGYRAVTLEVDANSALNGMIQPESYVDISLTVQGKQPELGGLATLTLLRGARVLATSHSRFRRSEDRPSNVRNITVAVSSKQANKLILAQRYGTLSVTLRSNLEVDTLLADDSAEQDPELINPMDLLGLTAQPEPVPVEKRAQIWRGGQMQELTFGVAQVQEAANTAWGEPAPAAPSPSGCKECDKKQQQAAAAGSIPTPAPPQDTASLATGARFEQRPHGQAIYIPVRAEAAGATTN
ncbi:MAG: Flp pilus assembly protein CpaB [Pirellulales bacterium]|nr:Flp pilus assembly protein CpaB [Pirellulales bacterium]